MNLAQGNESEGNPLDGGPMNYLSERESNVMATRACQLIEQEGELKKTIDQAKLTPEESIHLR